VKNYITAKRYAWERYKNTHPSNRGSSQVNLLKEFPIFHPNMGGDYQVKAQILSASIRNTLPFLSGLSQAVGHAKLKTIDCSAFSADPAAQSAALRLQKLFNLYGSDKSNLHNYHWLYGEILKHHQSVQAILEIGLGTNNETVACNMGKDGRPGASILAFRDFCENATLYGADIDESILFQDERISTFVVDQTKPESLEALLQNLPAQFDLVIDDGLHTTDANILTLCYGLTLIKPGGWVVIEDILDVAEPVWQIVAALLPVERYRSHFIKADNGYLFAVQRCTS
ncbi:MAG: class I SAM-dependent methyltransferase, partial [Cyanobacteriota bacterium]|nr:class I SAM-dependent methyltransferase [Cyanobacteriota bacterium]